MKRILFFVSDFKIGISSLLTSQAEAFNSIDGFEFTFVGSDLEQAPGLVGRFRNLTLFRIPALDVHKDAMRLVRELQRIVEERRITLVHVQNNWQLALVCLLKLVSRQSFSIIYTIHGFRHNYRLKSSIARLVMGSVMLAAVDKVIAASSIVGAKFSFLGRRLHILPLGVDDRFSAVPRTYDEQAFSIIFPAQFRHGKNQELLVGAVHRLTERVGTDGVRLVLPGDGPTRQACEALVERCGLQEVVRFPGQTGLEDLRSMYAAASIAVVPTNYETFGHCVAEPFVMGRCVVSRKVGVAVDIIEDGYNGFLFDSEEDLAGILERLYHDRPLMQRCADNAYASRRTFDWRSIADSYRQIVSGR